MGNVGPEFTDVMVDIETGGLDASRTPILQIAAVKFNLEAGTICSNFFDQCLDIPEHRNWDQSTLAWWAQQKSSTLEDILARARPWLQVMNEFADFSYQNPGLRMWAKPTHFDFVFVDSYFKDANLPNPFHYRIARDLNSYLEGLFYGTPDGQLKIQEVNALPFTGAVHNGLDDTLHQIKMLFHAKELKDATLS